MNLQRPIGLTIPFPSTPTKPTRTTNGSTAMPPHQNFNSQTISPKVTHALLTQFVANHNYSSSHTNNVNICTNMDINNTIININKNFWRNMYQLNSEKNIVISESVSILAITIIRPGSRRNMIGHCKESLFNTGVKEGGFFRLYSTPSVSPISHWGQILWKLIVVI